MEAGAEVGATWSGMMLEEPTCPQKIASARLVSMKITATPVVTLLKNVAPPDAPKTVLLPPPLPPSSGWNAKSLWDGKT